MPIHEAEAIVLRQYSLSDSDRIIVLITREFGKIRCVGKGVKKLQSRFAGCLEPLNHIRIEFYSKEGQDLNQIRRTELIRSYLGLSPGLNQVYAYSYFAEIANEVVQDNQANHPLFRLFIGTMEAGNKLGVNAALVRYFETWCLKLNGLIPNYAYCSGCGKCVKDDGFFAWIEVGQTRCQACAQGRGIKIGAQAALALTRIAKLPPEQFAAEPLEALAAVELERLSQSLLALHLEKQLKSYRILKEALQSE